jgi:ABC-type branched-subunit amino acid transport system substrate-binding protein
MKSLARHLIPAKVKEVNEGRPHARRGHLLLPGVLATAVAVVFTACSVVAIGPAAADQKAATMAESTSSAPGVTAKEIKVGAIADLTGTIAADFAPFMPGEEAYFDMVNANGGVNGRKIDLAWKDNDNSTGSLFTTQAKQLVEQDHVFAVTGVSSYVSPLGFLAQSGTPTYGWDVTGGWTGPKDLYAAGGSTLYYTSLGSDVSYLMKKTMTKRVGILAYNVSGSAPACTAAGKMLKRADITVAFENINGRLGSTYTSTVQRMKSAGVDFVLSCMQDTDNVTLARDMHEYGLKATQLWLTAGGQQLVDHYASLMTGVYTRGTIVPFTAPLKYYPGVREYLDAMKKYEPGYVDTSLAETGWSSAALFVAGVRAAGSDLTQQRVIQLTNKMSKFTATGLMTVTKWTSAHTKSVGPWCIAYTQVHHGKIVARFGKGHQVFTCLGRNAKDPVPVKPPPGTPGT